MNENDIWNMLSKEDQDVNGREWLIRMAAAVDCIAGRTSFTRHVGLGPAQSGGSAGALALPYLRVLSTQLDGIRRGRVCRKTIDYAVAETWLSQCVTPGGSELMDTAIEKEARPPRALPANFSGCWRKSG
jgi:hypothetical protein